jgi:hypothetical protein
MAWIDFTNDGFLDLFQANGAVIMRPSPFNDDPFAEPNLVFEGGPGGTFSERTPRGATAGQYVATSRAAAFGDVNNDGGIDVLVVNRDAPAHLFLNVVPRRGNWILFRVVDEHGRDAEGAIVTLRSGDRELRRDVRTAYSYLAGNDPRVHFGLGAAGRVEETRVRWLDGARETFGPFEANAIVTLRRGSGR